MCKIGQIQAYKFNFKHLRKNDEVINTQFRESVLFEKRGK